MTLNEESKPLFCMTAQFNFLEHRHYFSIEAFSHITPFFMHKKWMCLVSCKRHKGSDSFFCMPFANELKCVSIHSHWSKKFPCCTYAFFHSSCKRHNHRHRQGTLSADSRSLSLCFLICPFYAMLVCVASKQVQIQPQMGTISSTQNATSCFIVLI